MSTTTKWLLLGIMAFGLAFNDATVRAQPTTVPGVTDSDDKPWNQGVSIESREVARELFLEGNRLFSIPLFAQAAEQYSAALRKWQHPAFYYNLALAQLQLGNEVDAHENFEHALRHQEALSAEDVKEARKQLAELERQLGQIRVICRTLGAEVTLDGITMFVCPDERPRWTRAKHHELTAKKAGYLSVARRVTVAAGKLQEIELKLVTLTEATDTSRRWAVWKPWAVVAVGGAIAAGGGVLQALAVRSINDYDRKFLSLPCIAESDPASPGCRADQVPAALDSQLNRSRRQQMIAVGAYVAGGSLIAAGVVLLYLNRPGLGEQREGSSTAQGVSITPDVSSGMFGVAVRVKL